MAVSVGCAKRPFPNVYKRKSLSYLSGPSIIENGKGKLLWIGTSLYLLDKFLTVVVVVVFLLVKMYICLFDVVGRGGERSIPILVLSYYCFPHLRILSLYTSGLSCKLMSTVYREEERIYAMITWLFVMVWLTYLEMIEHLQHISMANVGKVVGRLRNQWKLNRSLIWIQGFYLVLQCASILQIISHVISV